MRDDTMDRVDETPAGSDTARGRADGRGEASASEAGSGSDLRSRVLAFERGLLVAALEATGGHQRRAAAMLGLLPTTFHEKLKRHGILR